jgi:hypothetical protein
MKKFGVIAIAVVLLAVTETSACHRRGGGYGCGWQPTNWSCCQQPVYYGPAFYQIQQPLQPLFLPVETTQPNPTTQPSTIQRVTPPTPAPTAPVPKREPSA